MKVLKMMTQARQEDKYKESKKQWRLQLLHNHNGSYCKSKWHVLWNLMSICTFLGVIWVKSSFIWWCQGVYGWGYTLFLVKLSKISSQFTVHQQTTVLQTTDKFFKNGTKPKESHNRFFQTCLHIKQFGRWQDTRNQWWIMGMYMTQSTKNSIIVCIVTTQIFTSICNSTT